MIPKWFLERSSAFFRLSLFRASLTTFNLEFVFHVYAHENGVTGVAITNEAYPSRIANGLIGKIVQEFCTENPEAKTATGPVPFPALKDYIAKYQTPDEVDNISAINNQLEETKVVLHKTIESVSRPSPIPIIWLHCGHCL